MKSLRLLYFILSVFAVGCVPLKKQLYLQDLSKSTLKERQSVDTILPMQPYTYKLRPGDVLRINVQSIFPNQVYNLSVISQLGEESAMGGSGTSGGGGAMAMASGYMINDSGYVNIPILGKAPLSNLSLNEAQHYVDSLAKQFLEGASASVRLINYRVMMLGEVAKNGPVMVPDSRITIMEAVANAGGLTEYANRNKIKIVRDLGESSHIFYVSILDQNFISDERYYLRPNDIIIVEPLRLKQFDKYFSKNLSLTLSIFTTSLLVLRVITNPLF